MRFTPRVDHVQLRGGPLGHIHRYAYGKVRVLEVVRRYRIFVGTMLICPFAFPAYLSGCAASFSLQLLSVPVGRELAELVQGDPVDGVLLDEAGEVLGVDGLVLDQVA